MRIKLLSVYFIWFQLGFCQLPITSGVNWSVSNLTSNTALNSPNTILYGPDDFLWITEPVLVTKIKYSVNTLSHSSFKTKKLTLLPNPAKNKVELNFNTNTSSFNIKIIDALGRTIKYINNIKTGYTLNTSHFLDGIYFVSLYSLNNKNIVTKKLIIKH